MTASIESTAAAPAWVAALEQALLEVLGDSVRRLESLPDEVAIECAPEALLAVATALRDHPQLGFDVLIDLAGVDYLHYGRSEWKTLSATGSGFSRGVNRDRGNEAAVSAEVALSVFHSERP